MIIFFILGILLGGVSVVFVLQNVTEITVNFLAWHITGSLAMVLIVSIAAGLCIALLMLLPENIANYFKYTHVLSENKKLHDELKQHKEKVVESHANTAPSDIITP